MPSPSIAPRLMAMVTMFATACATAVPAPPGPPAPPAPPAPALAPPPALRTQTRPLPRDVAMLRGLRAVTLSRDGERVAYTVVSPSVELGARPSADDPHGGWKVEQQLYVVDRAGGAARLLTSGDQPVSSPRFSPDGRSIAFLRDEAGTPTIHVLALAGGAARTVAVRGYAPKTVNWAPDGRSLAVLANRPETAAQEAARWQRGGAHPFDADWPEAQLVIVPLAGGEPRAIDHGPGSVVSFAWSPDGSSIALVVAPSAEPVEIDSFHQLVVVSPAGGAAQVLDRGDGVTPFVISQLAWSPDARQLAYSVTARGGQSHIDELRVRTIATGATTDAAATLDLEITSFAWAGDSRALIASTIARTITRLYRLSLDGGQPKPISIGRRVCLWIEADRTGRYLVGASSTPSTFADPTVIDLERGTATAIVRINPQLADWTIARTEVVRWTTADHVALDGVLTVTEHAKDGVPPPLIVLPHGGPDWVSLEALDSWTQFFAARGYSVLAPNYRGGLGYGRAFYEANRGRHGDLEYGDIESGVDQLIATGQADPARLFYAGWSWGGYISAWTLGHTDRYRAFMIGAGISDLVMQYAGSDISHGVAADWDHLARPWPDPAVFDRANPSRWLAHARAPTLIVHGENDHTVPPMNSLLLYRALRDRGTPVAFWEYPREGHGFHEPAHIQHLLQTWAEWFDRQLVAVDRAR